MNDTFTQQALANSSQMRQRLKAGLARQAYAVFAELVTVPGHATRIAYARAFLANPDGVTNSLLGAFVFATNVLAATTAVGFDGVGGVVVTSAVTDLAIDSQLQSDWNNLAGV